jgi:hypothetical protein
MGSGLMGLIDRKRMHGRDGRSDKRRRLRLPSFAKARLGWTPRQTR